MATAKLYRDSNFLGGYVEVTADVKNLKDLNFNDVTSSVVVDSGTFTLFENSDFTGWSVTVSSVGGPNSDGRYPNSDSLGAHNDAISSVRKNSDEPK